MRHFTMRAAESARARRITFEITTAAVLWIAALPAAQAQSAKASTDTVGSGIEEVTVTATRRAEPLSKVAISVSTFSAEQMDERGVKNFDDLVRLSPGLNVTHQSATGANQIAIRGISSSAGSGTTGVYIDDTPIQVRNLGFGAGSAFPGLFDVERVEVLRGPQGTLFGAGSEGGTVRFITTEPSLKEQQTYVRSELGTMAHGAPSYEGGIAVGGPIVEDRLGFRISAFYRHEGGWIDAVNGTYQILDASGASYGNSVAFTKTQTIEEDINWNRTVAVRAALKWQPNDSVTVTPAVFYQKHHLNDGAGNYFDLATSDLGSRDYSRQYYLLGAPGTSYTLGQSAQTTTLNAMNAPNNAFGDDEFTLSSVGLNWDLGSMMLVSNTSYFDRTSVQWYDYTKGYAQYYSPEYFIGADFNSTGTYTPLGWKAMALYNNAQGNFVQEIRLQSKDAAARLSWVAGVFYSHNRQTASEPISENWLENSSWVGFYPTSWGYGYYGVNGGAPFGAGSTAAQNFWGDNMLPNAVSFSGTWKTVEEQLAGFAQADITLVDRLKLTLGLRVSRNKLDFNAAYLGPENNAAAPFGFPCLPGTGAAPGNDPLTACAPPEAYIPPGTYALGTGPYTPQYPVSAAHSSETATTPKIGLSYQINDANLLYATGAKGFRPAGASLRVPAICNTDLINNGYVDSSGNPTQPTTYNSDSVWSYEVGSKNRLLGGRLVLDGSAYLIKWKSIQANVSLPQCSYNFVDNLADATSKGFDLAFQFKATDRLALSGSFGYNDPKFDHDAKSPGGKVIYYGGSSIPDAGPPISLTLSAEYAMPLANGRGAYARVDYDRSTEWRRYGVTQPGTPYYDSRLKPIPAYDTLNLRLGTRFSNFDLSLFVLNVQDRAPALALTSSTYYDPQDWQNVTLRPRTYGLTLMWRH